MRPGGSGNRPVANYELGAVPLIERIPSFETVFKKRLAVLRLPCMTDKRLMQLVGKRVRELRIARGLKQEDMCRFGFDYKYYQRIEYGQKNLTLKTLNKLANAFGVPLSELFRFD